MKTQASIYWLTSYPKSGNTWMRVFIANLVSNTHDGIDINADAIALAQSTFNGGFFKVGSADDILM